MLQAGRIVDITINELKLRRAVYYAVLSILNDESIVLDYIT
jgi:hypothetical protein